VARVAATIERLATFAMGTRFELVLAGDGDHARGTPSPVLRSAGEAALAEIEEADRRLSLFRRDSDLSFWNRTAGRRPVRVDAETLRLLRVGLDAWEGSEGAFDPDVARSMRAWGFHEGYGGSEGRSGPCEGDRRRPPFVLDEATRTIRYASPDVQLDLGGIAKGHALDRAGRVLRDHGVRCALLHGGTSSALGIGSPPGAPGWRVALRGKSGSTLTVTLRDAALAVSGPHGRSVVRGGRVYGHVLDPRTSRPVRGTWLAVAVAPSACETDAWSTALVVLGRRPATAPGSLATAILRDAQGWRCEGANAGSVFALSSELAARPPATRPRPDRNTSHDSTENAA